MACYKLIKYATWRLGTLGNLQQTWRPKTYVSPGTTCNPVNYYGPGNADPGSSSISQMLGEIFRRVIAMVRTYIGDCAT